MDDRRDEGPKAGFQRLQRRVETLESALVTGNIEAGQHVLFDDLFEGVQILDFEHRYIYLNHSAARHGKYPREELIGRRMQEVYPDIEGTELFRRLDTCLRARVPGAFTNYFTFPDGTGGWFDLRMDPVPAGVLILSVDVSEQKQVLEELQRSREDLAITLNCLTEGVVATDVDGHVTGMNPAAERLLGWAEPEAAGRSLEDVVQFLDLQSGQRIPLVADQVRHGPLRVGGDRETAIVARDGTRIPVVTTGAPMRDPSGAARGFVFVLKNMKEEHDLAAMLRRAQKMEALGLLAGGVAHDFNNLLTVIAGNTDLLLEGLGSSSLRSAVREIQQAGERSARLTRQLLAFSRHEIPERRVLDLNDVIIGAEELLRRLLGANITLSTSLHPGAVPILADPGQMEQVLMNLVVNARDAMATGGVLRLETAAPSASWAMLTVVDTGCGMDETTRERIFEPFFTTKADVGTGLGLATVFGIVQQGGGHIEVESAPGAGTTFRVSWPLTQGDPAPVVEPRTTAAETVGKETILVVEDEDAVRAVLVRLLQRLEYTVLETIDGTEAIRQAETHAGPIDLLITDVVLPGADGAEVAEAVRMCRPEVRVLLLSGYAPDSMIARGISLEGMAFLQKPFTMDVLGRKVREVLDARGHSA